MPTKDPKKRAEQGKRYRETHAAHIRAYRKTWLEKNKKREQERRAAYYRANKKKLDAINKKWARDHPEERRETNRRYRETKPEQSSARYKRYADKHPEKLSVQRQRRRARIANAGGAGLTEMQWDQILTVHNHRCVYCGAVGKLEIDHIVPIAKDGLHDPSNVVPACERCNGSKGARLLADWKSRPPRIGGIRIP